MPRSAMPQDIDPITAQIIRHRLLAIPKQIELNITRTAYSPLIYETKDYAVGLVDADGNLICESGGGIPLFVAGALGVGVRDGLAVHGRDGIKPGDVLISNHAGTLGQHLNNVIMYTPVFVAGNLVGFMAIIVHWVDIGGWAVGSAAPVGTTDIYQEGIQFRSVKLWSEGKRVEDMYRMIELNTRMRRELMGDIAAQLAGCFLGRDLFAALVERYTPSAVTAAIKLMWQRSETAARNAIRQIPDGVYSASSFLDNDGLDLDTPVPINVEVRVHGDEMTVDLSGVADQVRGSINSGRAGGALTAARIAFKYLCAPDDPANEGSYRPLHVEIPDGKFLSASGQAAMSMYSPPLPTVVDTILKAMVPALPDQVAAGHHANFGVYTFFGTHPGTGERFRAHTGNYAGWGASRGHDGPGPYKTMTHGDTPDAPVESLERLYPMRVERYELRQDSAGAGEYRGGSGFEKAITALAPCAVQLNFERTGCPPWGILGGHDGAVSQVSIERSDGTIEFKLKGTVSLAAGDRLRVLNSGGGGYGDPRNRDPAQIRADVVSGVISRHAAEKIYGLAVAAEGNPRQDETQDERATIKSDYMDSLAG